MITWWTEFKMLGWYGCNTAVAVICSYYWSESPIWQVACCHTHTNLPQGERNVGVGLLARATGSRTNSMFTKFLFETCLLLPHPRVPSQCYSPMTTQNGPVPFSNKTRSKLAKKCPMDNEKRTERVKDKDSFKMNNLSSVDLVLVVGRLWWSMMAPSATSRGWWAL